MKYVIMYGSSGSGKSMLVECFFGLVKPLKLVQETRAHYGRQNIQERSDGDRRPSDDT